MVFIDPIDPRESTSRRLTPEEAAVIERVEKFYRLQQMLTGVGNYLDSERKRIAREQEPISDVIIQGLKK